ncbi:hypothetical protein Tco_0139864 [Tanacetum coccineum]
MPRGTPFFLFFSPSSLTASFSPQYFLLRFSFSFSHSDVTISLPRGTASPFTYYFIFRPVKNSFTKHSHYHYCLNTVTSPELGLVLHFTFISCYFLLFSVVTSLCPRGTAFFPLDMTSLSLPGKIDVSCDRIPCADLTSYKLHSVRPEEAADVAADVASEICATAVVAMDTWKVDGI